MNTGPATSSTITFICEGCGQLNRLEGSFDPKTYTLRVRYAECEHCGKPRTETQIPAGCFKCVECRVVYLIRKYWRPVKGMCMACYMRMYRAKKKKDI